MAYSVVLRLNANSSTVTEFQVKKAHCRYERSHNAMSPDTSPRCLGIEVTVLASIKNGNVLTDWYVNNLKMKGKLVVCEDSAVTINALPTQDISERVIAEFENATCYYIGETYEANMLRKFILHFDAETVTCNNVEFTHL